MAFPSINLVGQRFGRLIVLESTGERNRGCVVWNCLCNCGVTKLVASIYLTRGDVKSCGCMRHGHAASRDRRPSPEYCSWRSMLARCRDSKHSSFKYYGGRGITVCERWDSFENFLADMGPRPPDCSLDRIDPNGNYEPKNCRWATPAQQTANQRSRSTAHA